MKTKAFEQACVDSQKKALSVISEMKAGKVQEGISFSEDINSGKSTIREMIGTEDGAKEFLEKITFDLYTGREAVPLMYKSIYQTLVDANFPKTLTLNEFGPVSVVFLEHLEGDEVKFGTLEPGTQKVVSFVTYAAGIEYDEDILEYNQTWRISEIGLAFGEAYNKLLNHVHLNPIIAGTYATTSATAATAREAQNGTGDYKNAAVAQLIAFNTSIATTLRQAMEVFPKGSIILANSVDQYILEDALFGSLYSDDVTPTVVRRKFNPNEIIYYDGSEVVVGGKTIEYDGVASGFIYIIYPKTRFKEYIKHDLRVDSDDGDLSRLILAQVVGRSRRAVATTIADKYGAIKVDIIT